MAMIANSQQYEVWNGDDGLHWAEHDERYAAMAAEASTALLAAAAVELDDRVLDVGCGTGHTTLLAAKQAPEGHATGVDLSGPMLERARRLAAADGRSNAGFEQVDAQVHPFPAGRFDVVISQAGVMFFDDPTTAFRNLGNAMVPGGRLALLCHRTPAQSVQRIFAAAAEHLAVPSMADQAPGVADFADPAQVRALLDGTGFHTVTITAVDYSSPLGNDAEDATGFLFEGHLRPWLTDAEPEAARRARDAVYRALRAFETPDGLVIPAAGWLITAYRR